MRNYRDEISKRAELLPDPDSKELQRVSYEVIHALITLDQQLNRANITEFSPIKLQMVDTINQLAVKHGYSSRPPKTNL